jgi:hypothetical protein
MRETVSTNALSDSASLRGEWPAAEASSIIAVFCWVT